jgi:hypothetical protein
VIGQRGDGAAGRLSQYLDGLPLQVQTHRHLLRTDPTGVYVNPLPRQRVHLDQMNVNAL